MSGRKTPTLALLLTFTIYVAISLDGVDVLLGALVRGIIQLVLMYAIALWVVKKLKFPAKLNNNAMRPVRQPA